MQANEYEANQKANDDIFSSYWDDEPEEEKKEEEQKPKNELKENLEIHVLKSMEYYDSVNIPLLGLVFYLEHKDQVEFNDSILFTHLYNKSR